MLSRRSTMHCRFRVDKQVGRYWLPECMGGAVYGPHGCTCPTDKNGHDDWEERIERLEEQVKQLNKKIEKE